MNKRKIFYALMIVLVCFVLLYIECNTNDKNITHPEQLSEYNETMKCMKWNGTMIHEEHVGNESGYHLTNNFTERFIITRNEIELFDSTSGLYEEMLEKYCENCSSVNIRFLFDEYDFNRISWTMYINMYYESQCLLDYETHSSEFESDVCLEYIKVYKRDD